MHQGMVCACVRVCKTRVHVYVLVCVPKQVSSMCAYVITVDCQIITVFNRLWYQFTTRKSLKIVEKVSIILQSAACL
jgi:hypothetical protein